MALRSEELHPDFEESRLTFLADMFARCRTEAYELHRAGSGETPWSLGCRCYDRITFAIEHAARSGLYPWLGIIQARAPGEPFIFRIGSQPLKFYTGNSAKPTARSLRIDPPELRAMTLFGSSDGTPSDIWVWRIAINVDIKGRVVQVTLIQATERGWVRQMFSIPFSGNPTGIVIPLFQNGITQPPPDVGTWEEEAEADDGSRVD